MSPADSDSSLPQRPPSVDALARTIAEHVELPAPLRVRCARMAIGSGGPDFTASAIALAQSLQLTMVQPVINATGVLLHTNLGRAPHLEESPQTVRASSLEFDIATGARGSRQSSLSVLISELTGAQDAVVVNNNAAAVLLVLAATAAGRDVTIARGESVEIGGGFRIPDVLEQSGARLIDVGTTNRTRTSDYRKAIDQRGNDVACIMRIHPSNFHIQGFTEQAPLEELSQLGVPVIADIGSGLIDARCQWLSGPPPQWLSQEPAATQCLQAGAALVTFSGDKLLGGPQCGIIAGSHELVAACRAHPLMRALRPGSHVVASLQEVLLNYINKTVTTNIPFWQMATTPTEALHVRGEKIVATLQQQFGLNAQLVPTQAMPGAGSTPGAFIDSFAVSLSGNHVSQLRKHRIPVIARSENGQTLLDLRSFDSRDDGEVTFALSLVK